MTTAKTESPLIGISHAIDIITLTANLSSDERSRAIMALLISNFFFCFFFFQY